MYKKGDIVFYHHKNGTSSRAKQGPHNWVILHSYTHPLKTYLIAPITSSSGYPDTEVEIKQKNYSDILSHNSYIDLRFITVINEEKIRDVKGIDDATGKATITLSETPKLNSLDKVKVDLAAIRALELGDTVKQLAEKLSSKSLENLKKEIENEFKKTSKKIEDALSKIEDEEVKGIIHDLLENFIKTVNK